MEIKERFLNYVNFDTQSDSYSHTVPSTSKQLKLGNYLVEELKSLGIENTKIERRYSSAPFYLSNKIISR